VKILIKASHEFDKLGEFGTVSDTNYYVYEDGALCRNVAAGKIKDRVRPTRVAGKYKIYVDSFPDAALPYSVYHIADTETGNVVDLEVTHGTGFNKLKAVTEYLKSL